MKVDEAKRIFSNGGKNEQNGTAATNATNRRKTGGNSIVNSQPGGTFVGAANEGRKGNVVANGGSELLSPTPTGAVDGSGRKLSASFQTLLDAFETQSVGNESAAVGSGSLRPPPSPTASFGRTSPSQLLPQPRISPATAMGESAEKVAFKITPQQMNLNSGHQSKKMSLGAMPTAWAGKVSPPSRSPNRQYSVRSTGNFI